MVELGRNDPCWCGSGKKFKKCHLNREDQVGPSIWEGQARFREVFKKKTGCLHPEAGPAACRGPVVRGHTVRRSADLKAIARDGRVYQGTIDFAQLNETSGRIIPKFVGIGSASTFWGFCEGHDTSTFAALETQAFGPTDQQAFLLAYRPLVKELYLKLRHAESNELCRDTDKGRPPDLQFAIQEFLNQYQMGVQSAIYDLEHHKALFDADLLAKDFGNIRHVTIHLDRTPDIMSSGFLQPECSFDGAKIQDVSDIDSVLQEASFSLLATASGGAAVFSWRADSDAASAVLVDSLLALPEADIPAALVRFTLSELENSFLRPTWWEGLDPVTREALIDRVNHNVSPILGRDYARLRDDGIRPVNWRVTRIDQKRS